MKIVQNGNPDSNSKKTKTVSFRVPEDIIMEIEKEAKSRQISTNVVINQILFSHVIFYRYRQKMRIFPVSEDSLNHILKNLDETKRDEAIEITYNTIRDWSLISKKRFDLTSCLEVFEDYCRVSGISYEDNITLGRHAFVIRHNLGEQFSLFMEKLIERIFLKLAKTKVDCESTKTTIIVKPKIRID